MSIRAELRWLRCLLDWLSRNSIRSNLALDYFRNCRLLKIRTFLLSNGESIAVIRPAYHGQFFRDTGNSWLARSASQSDEWRAQYFLPIQKTKNMYKKSHLFWIRNFFLSSHIRRSHSDGGWKVGGRGANYAPNMRTILGKITISMRALQGFSFTTHSHGSYPFYIGYFLQGYLFS